VFIVRPGNPKGIRGWNDLIRPGVEVLTPDPWSSGGARWNIMAAYGAQLQSGNTPQQAIEYLKRLLRNVSVRDKSARESLQTFSAGKGDAMLAYESEAVIARGKGLKLDYVIPDQTMRVETPVGLSTSSSGAPHARAFLDYLYTPEAQRIFGRSGYRPVRPDVLAEFGYPTPPAVFSVADLGGWQAIQTGFFEPVNGVFAEVERSVANR
jgi:sulfate/thiosulfate transport system substrate-binding protein